MEQARHGEAHRCGHPTDEEGAHWSGERDQDAAPVWECPVCGRWWGFAWPGHGSVPEDLAWLPMRDIFIGHRPAEFAELIDAVDR